MGVWYLKLKVIGCRLQFHHARWRQVLPDDVTFVHADVISGRKLWEYTRVWYQVTGYGHAFLILTRLSNHTWWRHFQCVRFSIWNRSFWSRTGILSASCLSVDPSYTGPSCYSFRLSVSVSVCLSVCLCVCLYHSYSPNAWMDLDETWQASIGRWELRSKFWNFWSGFPLPSNGRKPCFLVGVGRNV